MTWESRTGDNDEYAFKFFGSLLLKHPKFALGGEYMMADDADGIDTPIFGDENGDVDGFWWVGGRFFVNPMVTLQAGYINNADLLEDEGDLERRRFQRRRAVRLRRREVEFPRSIGAECLRAIRASLFQAPE